MHDLPNLPTHEHLFTCAYGTSPAPGPHGRWCYACEQWVQPSDPCPGVRLEACHACGGASPAGAAQPAAVDDCVGG